MVGASRVLHNLILRFVVSLTEAQRLRRGHVVSLLNRYDAVDSKELRSTVACIRSNDVYGVFEQVFRWQDCAS